MPADWLCGEPITCNAHPSTLKLGARKKESLLSHAGGLCLPTPVPVEMASPFAHKRDVLPRQQDAVRSPRSKPATVFKEAAFVFLFRPDDHVYCATNKKGELGVSADIASPKGVCCDMVA